MCKNIYYLAPFSNIITFVEKIVSSSVSYLKSFFALIFCITTLKLLQRSKIYLIVFKSATIVVSKMHIAEFCTSSTMKYFQFIPSVRLQNNSYLINFSNFPIVAPCILSLFARWPHTPQRKVVVNIRTDTPVRVSFVRETHFAMTFTLPSALIPSICSSRKSSWAIESLEHNREPENRRLYRRAIADRPDEPREIDLKRKYLQIIFAENGAARRRGDVEKWQ